MVEAHVTSLFLSLMRFSLFISSCVSPHTHTHAQRPPVVLYLIFSLFLCNGASSPSGARCPLPLPFPAGVAQVNRNATAPGSLLRPATHTVVAQDPKIRTRETPKKLKLVSASQRRQGQVDAVVVVVCVLCVWSGRGANTELLDERGQNRKRGETGEGPRECAARARRVCVSVFFLFVYATARGMRGSVRMPAEGDRRGRAVA